jgi:hypothetical protein
VPGPRKMIDATRHDDDIADIARYTAARFLLR